MSKSSEMHIQVYEAEELDAKCKETRAASKEALKPKIKAINGKPLILKGIVDKIEPIKSNFGHSWRIKMGNSVYYFNSSSENGAAKMFKEGEKSAFTVKETPNKREPEKPYLVIEHIFYQI